MTVESTVTSSTTTTGLTIGGAKLQSLPPSTSSPCTKRQQQLEDPAGSAAAMNFHELEAPAPSRSCQCIKQTLPLMQGRLDRC